MFFNNKPRLAFIFCITLLTACGSRPCIEGMPTLNYVSFTDAETDSIILRKYVKDGGFTSLMDSVIISKSNSIYQKSNDTLHILTSPYGGDYPLDIHFDYEVYMPFANKLFRISNIVVKQTEVNEGISMDKTNCLDPIKSYTLNGQIINTNSYVLYLKN